LNSFSEYIWRFSVLNKLKNRFTPFLFLFLLQFLCKGQSVYTAEITSKPQRISNKFVYLKDESNLLSFDEVLKSKDFQAVPGEVPNFNITSATIWGKVFLTPVENSNWYLSLDPASYSNVTFYQKKGNTAWEELSSGITNLNANAPLIVNHFFIKLNLVKGDTTLLLFKLKDVSPIQIDIKIGPLDSFIVGLHNIALYDGICIGTLLLMIIYNTFLYVSNREKVYLYYLFYILFSLTFSILMCGNIFHFPYAIKWLIREVPVLLQIGFGVFGLLFTVKFLAIRPGSVLYKTIRIFIILAVIELFFSISPFKKEALIFLQIMGGVLTVLSLWAGFSALKQKKTGAGYYLLGFGAYAISLIFLILSSQNLFPMTDFTWHVLLTGSGIEAVMLSFALGDKMKVLQLEKTEAQDNTLKALQENERIIKEQNVFLETKVKERTIELAEKNKEITDSINYARRIQDGILPPEEEIQKGLRDYFILYKPKDIVAGDFYWFLKTKTSNTAKDLAVIAAVDCTGHGVPGAFMSLLGYTLLNQTAKNPDVNSPADVLNYLNRELPHTLKSHGQEANIRDGMDMALCAFDFNEMKMHFSGANNPVWIIRENELIELKPDKQAITASDDMEKKSFTNHVFELQKGDRIYLFTDGFADQFGGPKGKKFKYKQLQEMLFAVKGWDMAEQKNILHKKFEDWKGELEQVDDVLLIGVRV
jgi:two-component system, sensor histidine kinase LadS